MLVAILDETVPFLSHWCPARTSIFVIDHYIFVFAFLCDLGRFHADLVITIAKIVRCHACLTFLPQSPVARSHGFLSAVFRSTCADATGPGGTAQELIDARGDCTETTQGGPSGRRGAA